MATVDLFWVKVAFALGILAVGLAGALLPWGIGSKESAQRNLALSDTFAGGVLGGAGLIHLLSGGIDGFRTAVPGLAYPLALLLAGAGFLLILLIEGVIVPGHLETPEPDAAARPAAVQHETGWPLHPEPGRARGHRAQAIVLLVVLSVHSVILGLALGAQLALSGAVVVFLAIVAHKAAAGFALGVSYQRAGFTRPRATPPVVLFSAMTPLGILLGAGAGVVLASHADQVFQATFDSIGAGTFLYIAALDIIKNEFESPDLRWQKWCAAALGFGTMAILAIWI